MIDDVYDIQGSIICKVCHDHHGASDNSTDNSIPWKAERSDQTSASAATQSLSASYGVFRDGRSDANAQAVPDPIYNAGARAANNQRRALLGGIAVLGVVILVVCIGWAIFGGSSVAPDRQDNTDTDTSDLPTVIVQDADGHPDPTIHFSGWHKDGIEYHIIGTMTWDGSLAVDNISYDVKRDGVRVDGGHLNVAGDYMKANEPVSVTVGLGRPATSKLTVLIKVQH